MAFKKLLILILLIGLACCEKIDSGKTCWDCYFMDNATGKVLDSKTYCDLTSDQMDTVRYDRGKCNTVSRKCFNTKYDYDKPTGK